MFQELRNDIKYSLYANDRLLRGVKEDLVEGIEQIQDSLSKIQEWSQKWALQFSVDKTKTVIFTKRKIGQVPRLKIGNEEIKCEKEIKFLGMYLDR